MNTEQTEGGSSWPESASPPDLVVTSERVNGRYVVIVWRRLARLSLASLNVLLTLVAAHGERVGEGFVRDQQIVYPMAVHRLRTSLDAALGSGEGKRLVETGHGCEYRLAPWLSVAIDHRLLSLGVLASANLSRAIEQSSAFVNSDEVMDLLSDCLEQ